MSATPQTRVRLSADDRRRQLLGIGLRMLAERPIQDLSIDEVAIEAGISRGLLFHYFPTKNAFHESVIDAALRRVLRNTAPDPGATGEVALEQLITRLYAQIERRREFYLALVHGNGTLALGRERVESYRSQAAGVVRSVLGLDEADVPTMQAWTAYVEDRALQWSGRSAAERPPVEAEVSHCQRALTALLAL